MINRKPLYPIKEVFIMLIYIKLCSSYTIKGYFYYMVLIRLFLTKQLVQFMETHLFFYN